MATTAGVCLPFFVFSDVILRFLSIFDIFIKSSLPHPSSFSPVTYFDFCFDHTRRFVGYIRRGRTSMWWWVVWSYTILITIITMAEFTFCNRVAWYDYGGFFAGRWRSLASFGLSRWSTVYTQPTFGIGQNIRSQGAIFDFWIVRTDWSSAGQLLLGRCLQVLLFHLENPSKIEKIPQRNCTQWLLVLSQ